MATIRSYGMGHCSETVVEVVQVVPLKRVADQEGFSVPEVDQAADVVIV
jgi:hypothetical protein